MFGTRSLRQITDSISEKAKAEGVPDTVCGELIFDVMSLRLLQEKLLNSRGGELSALLGEPLPLPGGN